MDHFGFQLRDVNAPETTEAPPWRDPGWLAAADAWIDESCEAAGLVRRGPAQARCRMYSVVARVPVGACDDLEAGDCVWFKANPPRSAFEPALAAALARWSPQDAPPVLAVDAERGWGLTANVGKRLDDLLKTDPDIRHLHVPLRRYAKLQRLLSGRVEELLALGIPDARPSAVLEMLDEEISLAPVDIVDPDVLAHARKQAPLLSEWAAELEAFGIPASIDHSDLHPGNVLGIGSDTRPFDWGDSCVAHPFGSLLVPLRALPASVGVPGGGEGAAELRDVYLKPWLAQGRWSEAELQRAVQLAIRLGTVLRTHSWIRVFRCFRDSPRLWENAQRWMRRIGDADPLAETTGDHQVPYRPIIEA